MLKNWNDVIITEIRLAMYVTQKNTTPCHKNRPTHGLVMDDIGTDKEIIFADGSVIKPKGGSVYYLPKGSDYQVKCYGTTCNCWAINFLTLEDLDEKPFVFEPKNGEGILVNFKEAVEAFERGSEDRNLRIRRNVYDIILRIRRETARIHSIRLQMIQPALDAINTRYADNALSVRELAACCQMSENYFRRIFGEELGTSPKEYIIRRRMEYAKALLLGEQFTVSEVAELCGYFEPCHFTREFTRRIGKSPSQYIKAPR